MVSDYLQRVRRTINRDRNFRRTMVNSGWLLGSNTISLGLNFLLSIIITRALGINHYGVFVLMMNYILTINQLIDSRVWEAVIKFIPQYMESGQPKRAIAALKLFYLVDACSAVVMLIVIWLTADFAANTLVKDPAMIDLLRFYALFVIIDFSTETSSALLRIHNRFKWLSYQDVAQAALKIVGALAVWILGGSLEMMIAAMLLTSLVGVIIMQVMAYRVAREMQLTQWFSAPLRLLNGEWRTILSFLFFTNLNASSRLVQQRVDVLLLGWLSTPAAAGVYEIAKHLVNQLQTFFGPLNVAVYPETSNLIAKGEYSQVTSLQKKVTKLTTTVAVPLCVILVFVFPIVIPLLFGAEYISAVTTAQVMVWYLPFTVSLIWLPGFLLALGQVRLLTALTWISTAVYVLVLLFAIPTLGAMGAAAAMLLRSFSWFVLAIATIGHLNRMDWRAAHRRQVGRGTDPMDLPIKAAK